MFTRRQFWGVILTIAGFEMFWGAVRAWALYHATLDPEHTWPARVGRAALVSI